MDILRERDEKINLERQLREEQKVRAILQKKLRREKRSRRNLQEQIELEGKIRAQYEDALKNAGAADQIDIINEKFVQFTQHRQQDHTDQKPSSLTPKPQHHSTTHSAPTQSPSPSQMPPPNPLTPSHSQSQEMVSSDRPERIKQEIEETPSQQYNMPQPQREMREQLPPQHSENKMHPQPWNYSGLDLINTGAAFWQNYSESLAQELEMERKARQHQQIERDVKSPMQDRSGYYKNSVLFTSSAT